MKKTLVLLPLLVFASGGIQAQVIFDADFDDTTAFAVTDAADLGSPLPAGASWAFDNGPAGALSASAGSDRAAVFPHNGNTVIAGATEIVDNVSVADFDPIIENVDPKAVGDAGGVQLLANFSAPISVTGTTASTVSFDWGTFGNGVTGTQDNGGFKQCYCRGLDSSGNEVFKILFVSGNTNGVRELYVQGADDDTVTVLGGEGIPAGDKVVDAFSDSGFNSTNTDVEPTELVGVSLSFANSEMTVDFTHSALTYAEDFDDISERVFGLNTAATEIVTVEFTPVYNRFARLQNKGFWLDNFLATSDGTSPVFECGFDDAADVAFTQPSDLGTVTPVGAAWSFRNDVAFGGNSVAVEGDKAVVFAENGSADVSAFVTEWPAGGANQINATLPVEGPLPLDSGSGTVLRGVFATPGPVRGASGTQISFDWGHYGNNNLTAFKCGVVSGYSSLGDQVFELLLFAGSGNDTRRLYARGPDGSSANPPDDFQAVEIFRNYGNANSTNVANEPATMLGVTITVFDGLVQYELDAGNRGTIGNVVPMNSAAIDIASIEFNYVWASGANAQNKGWWLDDVLVEQVTAPAITAFDAWRAEFAIQGLDVALGADADGDGLSTEDEYAYNGNPGKFTGSLGASGFSGLPVVASDGGGGFEVQFVKRNDVTLQYQPQTSQSLSVFDDYLGALGTVRSDVDYSVMSFPLSGTPSDFGRVEVTALPGFSIDLP